MREIPKPGERYRHFKNKEYQILAVATHSENGEKMVVYQALYGDYGVWVRPLSMFMEEVDREKYPDVQQKYRFERIFAFEGYSEKHSYDKEVLIENKKNSEEFRSEICQKKNSKLHPLVEEFLDQETTEGKLEILQLMSGKVTKQDLDSICFCLDMNPVGGSVEEELDAIRQCIRMQQKYDAPRLRYGK